MSAGATMRAADLVVSSARRWFSSFREPYVVRRRLARAALGLTALSLVVLQFPTTMLWPPRGGASAELARASASVVVPVEGPRSLGSASMPAPPGTSIAPAYSAAGKRTALIIGINRAAGSRRLEGAVPDARMLREALRRYGFPAKNITLLTDGAATGGRISEEIDRLAARTPSDGRAVFAFAGHTRKRGGVNQLVAADGSLISAPTLAVKLARVRAPMWVTLPTCFAEGYHLPGIVGRNRIVTFASDRNELAYELGSSGSWLMIHMVRRGMLDARAPHSVEQAFTYAQESIRRTNPDRAPSIDDRYHGDFSLGPVTWGPAFSAPEKTAMAPPPERENTSEQTTASGAESPQGSPPPSSGGVHVCGRLRYRCSDR